MLDGVFAVRATDGSIVLQCQNCHVQLHDAEGLQGKDQGKYLLICPKCGLIRGEWTTLESKQEELAGLANKL